MTEYKGKDEILHDLQQRVDDKILEPSNYDLLKKLLENADTLDEAIKIAELGTTYRRTGFHFDKKLEKQSDTIAFFKKNEALSFTTNPNSNTHKLIVGDNYPALLNLLAEYKDKIDVIYIDPPYGKDSMGEFAQTNYENAISRDNLLSMLYPRLWIAKQLLSENGVIFCSIDERNQAYFKGLFDEIFGESNSLATMVWKKKGTSTNVAGSKISALTEYILVYSNGNNSQLNPRKFSKEDRTYPYSDKDGTYRTTIIEKKSVGGYDRASMKFEILGQKPRQGKRWQIGIEKAKTLEANNRFILENGIIKLKIYDFEDKDTYAANHNLLLDVGSTQSGQAELNSILTEHLFDSPKPTSLIKHLLTIVGDDNATVLDFFAGSGTTGQAVISLNQEDGGDRQFVLVTNNEITNENPRGLAYDVTSRRLKRVMAGEDYDGDKNFTWLEKNKPLGGNLLVLDIAEVANFESTEGKTAFDVIDETLYGQERLDVSDKVKWVATNFEQTQKRLEEK